MYIEVRIVTSKNLTSRSYILFYIGSKRYRFFNGKKLGLDLYPNLAKTLKERLSCLNILKYEITNALNNGWNPELNYLPEESIEKVPVKVHTQDAFDEVLNEKLASDLSVLYKEQLTAISYHFMKFLTPTELYGDVASITTPRILLFLERYNTSGTNYNNKRRLLSVIFNGAISRGYLERNPLKQTKRKKQKSALHAIYSNSEMKKLLAFLKVKNEDLYLVCLFTYACLLRPHAEVRCLKGKHFKSNYSEIHLSGEENKSGRVRVVHVPQYVRDAMIERMPYMDDEINLFTLKEKVYGYAYFNCLWERLKPELVAKGLLKKNQTIYSFRHTAAIQIYKKCKDVSIVQQLMGHSTMIVTLTYLRSLGALNTDKYNQYLPTLELV